jgi:two-component system, sensor histidine kinase RegB
MNLFSLFRYSEKTSNSSVAQILWLVKLRWGASILFSVLSIPSLLFGFLDKTSMPAYLGLIGILILFNLIMHLYWTEKFRKDASLSICFQLAFDLLILAGFISLSRGFVNPFVVFFLLNVSLGGVLIPGRLSFPFLILAHSLLAVLQLRYFILKEGAVGPDLFVPMLAAHLLMLVFWVVMRSLGSYLEKQHLREAQLQVLAEKQDRLRAIGALSAGFSHEFASPLNVAKIRLERFLRIHPSDDISEALSALENCENIVKQMNSSQLDSRSYQLKNVVVKELLLDVVEVWKEEHPQAKLEINLSEPASGQVPPVNFAQVVMNLLDNAYEACPDRPIQIDFATDESYFNICFKDQGPGVPDSVLSKYGEPFVTTKINGTGLGLYVSQLFTQSLGGHLKIQNPPEGGAAITLCWPKAGVLHG